MADQLKSEIARLTASINLHKSSLTIQPTSGYQRSNSYVNPNYKSKNKYIRKPVTPVVAAQSTAVPSSQVKEVVLGGVAFQSSARSLVRKDLPISESRKPPVQYTRRSGHLLPSSRVYKPKSTRGRRGGPSNRNMTLTNSRRPYQSVQLLDTTLLWPLIPFRRDRLAAKRQKYMNKPCPLFTTTGACTRGLTCMYQHDPSKIAICWNFLQDKCPKTAETCNLSHEPTPERTPLCLHFLNNGRCTREKCPYPHVNVGARQGVCRDFAVLGYCEKGLDCDKQHVRECPDFAEKGTCSTIKCKLPHVIRANRNRKPAPGPKPAPIRYSDPVVSTGPSHHDSSVLTNENAQIGDEYISLTFNESESSEDDDDDGDDDDDEAMEQDDEEEEEEEASDDETTVMVHG
ncbi:hypothetical protein C8J56DRAFT_953365 [Mycena floridula]|nr:hypothetical protein C8J56DRAFT_953365 [Mycena floridula]